MLAWESKSIWTLVNHSRQLCLYPLPENIPCYLLFLCRHAHSEQFLDSTYDFHPTPDPLPKENFFGPSHPCFQVLLRIIFNGSVEVVDWVVLKYSYDAEALSSPLIGFDGSFFDERYHMRPDFLFIFLFITFRILLCL